MSPSATTRASPVSTRLLASSVPRSPQPSKPTRTAELASVPRTKPGLISIALAVPVATAINFRRLISLNKFRFSGSAGMRALRYPINSSKYRFSLRTSSSGCGPEISRSMVTAPVVELLQSPTWLQPLADVHSPLSGIPPALLQHSLLKPKLCTPASCVKSRRRTVHAVAVLKNSMATQSLQPLVLTHIRADLLHRAQPDLVCRVLQIMAQFFERMGIGYLESPLADLVPHKNHPPSLLDRHIDDLVHLRKIHIVEGSPHRLCQIHDARVIGGF